MPKPNTVRSFNRWANGRRASPIASTSLAEAAQVMVAHPRKVLPVVDDDRRLLGIVDRADLLHAASGALAELDAIAVEDDED